VGCNSTVHAAVNSDSATHLQRSILLIIQAAPCNRQQRHNYSTAPTHPQCGGLKSQWGPLPLGKRNCSTRS